VPVSEATYRRLAEEDFEANWELVCGHLRKKPGMTLRHNTISRSLARELESRLPSGYTVAYNTARLRLPGGDHYVPDVVVMPDEIVNRYWDETSVEAYREPASLVVEVRSPSTGDYDATDKLTGYQERGDLEIWLVDPSAQRVTAYVFGGASGYEQRVHPRGRVKLSAIPGVEVDLDRVFRSARL
jgi:Uma2 family endonuclease